METYSWDFPGVGVAIRLEQQVDYKELSCLILACPLAGKKSLIQVVGRILRKDIDKLNPVVIDLADLSVPGFTIPEVRMKKNIISGEFGCKIVEKYID